MAQTPTSSYRLGPETIQRLEALKRKFGVKHNITIIEMAIKKLADQELHEAEQNNKFPSNVKSTEASNNG